MLIYNENGIQVRQHPHLYLFTVYKWMEGDNPRSYGRTYGYFSVGQYRSITEVRNKVRELLNV